MFAEQMAKAAAEREQMMKVVADRAAVSPSPPPRSAYGSWLLSALVLLLAVALAAVSAAVVTGGVGGRCDSLEAELRMARSAGAAAEAQAADLRRTADALRVEMNATLSRAEVSQTLLLRQLDAAHEAHERLARQSERHQMAELQRCKEDGVAAVERHQHAAEQQLHHEQQRQRMQSRDDERAAQHRQLLQLLAVLATNGGLLDGGRPSSQPTQSSKAIQVRRANEPSAAGAVPADAVSTAQDLPICESGGLQMLSGVAKWPVLRPPLGAVQPAVIDELRLSVEAAAGNTTLFAGHDVAYRLGSSPPFGLWEEALRSMRHGERSRFAVAAQRPANVPAFGAPPLEGRVAEGDTIVFEVELLQVTQIEDVSAAADGSLLKVVLSAGRGSETPADGAAVRARLSASAAGAAAMGVTNRSAEPVDFELGGDECGEALRLVVQSMRRGEVARAEVLPPMGDEPLLNISAAAAPFSLEVELLSFTQPRSLEHMNASEALRRIERLKARANRQYAEGQNATACATYSKAWHILQLPEREEVTEEEAGRLSAVELALRLNSALCALRASRPSDSLTHADAAVAMAPNSAKAHYRRAQALSALGREAEAVASVESCLELEPGNPEARSILSELQTKAAATPDREGEAPAGETATTGRANATLETQEEKAGGSSAGGLIEVLEALKVAANRQYAEGLHATACDAYEDGLRQIRTSSAEPANAEEAGRLTAVELALRLNSALCAYRASRPSDSLAHADAAVALAPKSAKAHYRRAQALSALSRASEALASVDASLALDPASREANEMLRELQATSAGAAAKAEQPNAPSKRQEGNSSAFVVQLETLKETAKRQYEAGQHAKACDAFEDGLRQIRMSPAEPANAEEAGRLAAVELALRLNSALCALRASRPSDSLAHADAAVALAPKSAKAHYRRAQALSALGLRAEALASVKASLALDPASREANHMLSELQGEAAAVAAQAGDGEAAAGAAAKTADQEGTAGGSSAARLIEGLEALKATATRQYKDGQHAAACNAYEDGLRQIRTSSAEPANAEEAGRLTAVELSLRLNSALCAYRASRPSDSLAHADAAVALAPKSAKAHYRRAQALSSLGKLQEARAAVEASLALDPASLEANSLLAELAGRRA